MPQRLRRTFGERLRDARLEAQLTQTDVAAEFAKTRQAVSSWEQGKTLPDLSELRELVTLYGVSADAILFGVDVGEACAAALLKASNPRGAAEEALDA